MYTEPGNSILRHKVLSSWKHKVLSRVEAYSKQLLDTIQKHTAGPFDSKQNDVIMMFCVYALHVTVCQLPWTEGKLFSVYLLYIHNTLSPP